MRTPSAQRKAAAKRSIAELRETLEADLGPLAVGDEELRQLTASACHPKVEEYFDLLTSVCDGVSPQDQASLAFSLAKLVRSGSASKKSQFNKAFWRRTLAFEVELPNGVVKVMRPDRRCHVGELKNLLQQLLGVQRSQQQLLQGREELQDEFLLRDLHRHSAVLKVPDDISQDISQGITQALQRRARSPASRSRGRSREGEGVQGKGRGGRRRSGRGWRRSPSVRKKIWAVRGQNPAQQKAGTDWDAIVEAENSELLDTVLRAFGADKEGRLEGENAAWLHTTLQELAVEPLYAEEGTERCVDRAGLARLLGSCGREMLSTAAALQEELVEVSEDEDRMRAFLIRAAFRSLDLDGDKHLNAPELWAFALLTGFDGSEVLWNTIYKEICSERNCSPQKGLDLPGYLDLLLDQGPRGGCYCSNNSLRKIIVSQRRLIPKQNTQLCLRRPQQRPRRQRIVESVPGWAREPSSTEASAVAVIEEPGRALGQDSTSRSEILTAVFQACDQAKAGRLREGELRRFAKLALWFSGSDTCWAEEYTRLCGAVGANAEEGLNLEMLQQLVDGRAERSQCTTRQLRYVLRKLGTEVESPEPSGTERDEASPWTLALWTGPRQPTLAQLCAREESLQQPSPENAPAEEAPRSRKELVRALFNALAGDKGALDSQDLRHFAELTGFDGGDEDWCLAHKGLCQESGLGLEDTLDLAAFDLLLEDGASCASSDAELVSLLTQLGSSAILDTPTQSPRKEAAAKNTADRAALKGTAVTAGEPASGDGASSSASPGDDRQVKSLMLEAFLMLDANNDGCINGHELRHVSCLRSCPEGSIDFQSFRELWQHALREHGEAVTTASLSDLLQKLRNPPEARSSRRDATRKSRLPRQELMLEVFRLLNTDDSGVLSAAQIRPLADATGFRGSEEAFEECWQSLVHSEHCQASGGQMDFAAFALLLDDEDPDTGCYCDNTQLRRLLSRLQRLSRSG